MRLTLCCMIVLGAAFVTWSAFAGEYVDPPQSGMSPTIARGMHACDEGHVMSGVDIGQNRFLCVSPHLGGNPDDAKRRVIDTSTQAEIGGTRMHVCPRGMVMKGYEHARNLLLCEPAGIDEASVRGDTDTTRFGMHACPAGRVMKGIHVDRNILACVELGRFE